MKNTMTCPKCSSRDIIVIPGWLGPHGSGNNVITGMFSAVEVTRYLCGTCGFSEEWIDNVADIEKIRKKHQK